MNAGPLCKPLFVVLYDLQDPCLQEIRIYVISSLLDLLWEKKRRWMLSREAAEVWHIPCESYLRCLSALRLDHI